MTTATTNAPRFKLWLTVEVPGIYCDDFDQAAEDGFTPMDCLLEDMREDAALVVQLHGDESGPRLMSYDVKLVEAHAEPLTEADQ